jgi:hypothetical protein
MEGRWAISGFWRGRGRASAAVAGVADPIRAGARLVMGADLLQDRRDTLIQAT